MQKKYYFEDFYNVTSAANFFFLNFINATLKLQLKNLFCFGMICQAFKNNFSCTIYGKSILFYFNSAIEKEEVLIHSCANSLIEFKRKTKQLYTMRRLCNLV